MTEILDKLVLHLVGQANSGLVTWLIIALGYFAWSSYSAKKEYREELNQYKEIMQKLQASMNQKNGEEREMLLSIIEKYHQSQISIREAISEVRAVLTTISNMNHRNG